MVREFIMKKIDSVGRVTIPKIIRDRFNWKEGDELEVFTMKSENIDIVGFGKGVKDAKYKMAAEVLAELGVEVPNELKEKI